jgi:hypothetical protein
MRERQLSSSRKKSSKMLVKDMKGYGVSRRNVRYNKVKKDGIQTRDMTNGVKKNQ